MTQRVLNFSIESTQERLTSRSGEIIFGEYLHAIGLERLCNTHLPLPMSNSGYTPHRFIQSLLLMLHGGGRVLDDIRMIQSDTAMRELLNMDDVPTASAIAKWLKRLGLAGVYGIERINRSFLRRYLKRIRKEPLVLDIDASVIESHKSTAAYTYKMFPGFTPMIGHINGGYVIHSEFRSGNIAPADHNLSFVKRCIAQLPKGEKISFLRADSASYQAAIFNDCETNGIIYTIGAHLDNSVMENIRQINSWEAFGKHEEIAEFMHTMTHTDHAFRLIVIKKMVTPMLPAMEEVLDKEQMAEYVKIHYSVIATNADENMSTRKVIQFYRQRGDTSENRIKELKNGFNLSYLPTSDFISNAFYFQIGALAYNLFVLFKETLEKSWQRHTIQTIRYKLYNIAGKVVTHARETTLKVNDLFVGLLNSIRRKSYEITLE